MTTDAHRVTVPNFVAMKAAGHKITMLTAYDFVTARLLDESGIEAILVGDSMSMVVQGHESTLPVTLDEMIYHAEMVGRAVELTVKAPLKPKVGETRLRLVDLTMGEGGQKPRLSGISLELRAGEVLGIAGVEGNGVARPIG